MQKIKRKRHLTAAVLAFIAMLAIGGVFALAAGVLEIDGRLRIAGAQLCVVWVETPTITVNSQGMTNNISVYFEAPDRTFFTTPARSDATSTLDPDRTHRMFVDVEFGGGEALATIRAQVENIGTMDAILIAGAGAPASVELPATLGGVPIAEWGLDVHVNWAQGFADAGTFTFDDPMAGGTGGVLIPAETVHPDAVYIEIYWSGNIPAGVIWDSTVATADDEWRATNIRERGPTVDGVAFPIVISFNYAAA